jgi:tight adherence protein B
MLSLGIFVAVTAGLLTLFRVAAEWSPARSRFRRRFAQEFGAGRAERAPSPLYKAIDLDAPADRDPAAGGPDGAASAPPGALLARAGEFLRQAGVPLVPRQFLGLVLACAGCAAVLGLAAGGPLGGAAGGAAGALAPLLAVHGRRAARREKYLKQLVGAFELMARVLRAGQSVAEGFRAAVESFDDPLRGEFGQCLHQIEHGLRPEAAFRELSERAGILELRIFAVAMTVQRQTGGNLSEVLDRLAGVIRTRLRVRQKIRALTAEGRLQSVTLTVLPVITFGAMYALNRPYAEALFTQWRLLLGTAACMTVGTLWIRNIMSFEG